MNKVIITQPPELSKAEVSSIWKDPDNNNHYILCMLGTYQYVACNLSTGGAWRGLTNDIDYAVGNLTYVGKDLDITIAKKP